MTPVHGKLEVKMKKDYSKMYEKKNTAPVDTKNEDQEVVEAVIEEEKEESKHEEVIKEEPRKDEKITKPFMVEITGNLNLNVRKNPMGDIITSLAPGAQARVLEASEDGEWYQIESPKGFIMKKFTKKVR